VVSGLVDSSHRPLTTKATATRAQKDDTIALAREAYAMP
jgi:hypothetical protein